MKINLIKINLNRNEDISSTLIGISDVEKLRLDVKYVLEALNENDTNDYEEQIKKIINETDEITWQSGLPENN